MELVRLLMEGGLLGGLKRRLTRTHTGTDSNAADGIDHDVDYALGEATDALFVALSKGIRVYDLGAFLLKVARRRLADEARRRRREGVGRSIADRTDDRILEAGGEEETGDLPDHGVRRRAAFDLVRSLLPRLGQVVVQQVMGLVLEAAEANEVDLPDRVIAETLGITVATAKKARQRGFQRLERIAREEGLGELILARMRESSSGEQELDDDDEAI